MVESNNTEKLHKRTEHGGDIYRNRVSMDFSVNVNPFGTPDSVLNALGEAVLFADRYPDPMCEEVKEAIASQLKVDKERVVCGNGASELILFICRMVSDELAGKEELRALTVSPGFIGYEQALKSVRADVSYYDASEESGFTVGMDIVEKIEEIKPHLMFITNPGNPTGRIIEESVLEAVVNICEKTGTLLVIDECFIELTAYEDASYKNRLRDNLIILRALTKSFSLPGIRFGYAICGDADIVTRLEAIMPEWNVSLPAQLSCVAAMKEHAHLEKSREVIRIEREYVSKELTRMGIKVFPSDVNFVLLYTNVKLYEKLLEEKILIRNCSNYRGLKDGYYRLAIKQHSGNEILLEKIERILNA